MKRVFRHSKIKFLICLLFVSAIFSGAVSVGFFTKKSNETEETVYCPLTKKFQPVHPTKKKSKQNNFDEICTSEENKDSLAAEILQKISFNSFDLDRKQFENLAFDFFKKGETAFKNLPELPNAPFKNSFKNSATAAFSGNFKNQNNIFQVLSEKFGFSLFARPPNFSGENGFESEIVRTLKNISRSINPRSPPANLS